MHIEVKHLYKSFGNFTAVDDVSFQIEKGKLIGFLGPSGGGKTSILRMLAGLEAPTSGDIYFYGNKVNDIAPQNRGIGFVFQNYALFRHMTVFDNIAFGLKIKKASKKDIKARVKYLIELTGLTGFEHRYPHQLSGGQKQRVAFARALAPEPQLLLLDEPFAAIDAKIRSELRSWLKDMISKLGITSIFVTHDQEEAIEVADEIMIINKGRLEQKGTPWSIYKTPETPFVASFIGESSLVEHIHLFNGFSSVPADEQIKALIRPEYVEVGRRDEILLASAAMDGIVKHTHFRGSEWMLEVLVSDQLISTYRSLEKPELKPGEHVSVLIHRAYLFNNDKNWIMENALKVDPLPVYI